MIWSELTLRSRMIAVLVGEDRWSPLRSSVSAGAPRRIASLRFSELPASAVPNSLMISWRRRLKGSRSVFWTRSVWTVCSTWLAGMSGFGSSVSSSSAIGGPAGSQ